MPPRRLGFGQTLEQRLPADPVCGGDGGCRSAASTVLIAGRPVRSAIHCNPVFVLWRGTPYRPGRNRATWRVAAYTLGDDVIKRPGGVHRWGTLRSKSRSCSTASKDRAGSLRRSSASSKSTRNVQGSCSKRRLKAEPLMGFRRVDRDPIREHTLDPDATGDDPKAQAVEELLAIVHTYLT